MDCAAEGLFRFLIATAWLAVFSTSVLAQPEAQPKFSTSDNRLTFSTAFLTERESEFLAKHPKVRVAVQHANYAPYQYITPEGEIGGYSVEVLLAMTQALGIEVEPVMFNSWPDVLLALKERRVDLIAEISYAAERDVYLDYTMGIAPYPASIVGKVNDKRIDANPDLRGLKVAVGEGYIAEKHLRHYYPDAIPVPSVNIEAAIDSVITGEADIFLGATAIAMSIANQRAISDLEIKRKVYLGSGWSHIAVRSDWTVLTRLLARIASGQHDTIFTGFKDAHNHHMESVVPPLPLSEVETAIVERFGVMRVGAVRGLNLLNDFVDDEIHSGVASEFTSYLSHRLRVGVEVVAYDSTSQMLDGLRAAEIDIVPFLTPTTERELEFNFSDPYVRIPFMLLGKAGDTRYWGLDSLNGKTVAMRREHPLLPYLRRVHPLITVLEVEAAREAFVALADGRANTAIEIKLYANHLINAEFAGEIQVLGEVDAIRGDFAFASASNTAELIPIINRALDSIDDVQRDRIVARWVAVDLEPVRQLRRTLQILVPVLVGLALLALLMLFWNRRIAMENRRRLRAEKLVVDMTDGLATGVFQFKQMPDGRQLRQFANSAARLMSRIEDDDPLDAWPKYFDHIHPDEREYVLASLGRSFATGEPFRESYRFRFPDGQWGWIISEASAEIDEEDGCQVWNGYFFDLSDERAFAEKLNESLAAKEEFIATAGHELRTPVQNILLGVRSLGSEHMDAQQQKVLLATEQSAQSLAELINDLLDLSSMNAGSLSLTETVVDLRALVDSIVNAAELSAKQKLLAFSCDIESSAPDYIYCDALRIKQILTNLLGNAIKYTDSGFVRITVRSAPPAHAAGNLDTRVGNPDLPETMRLIFSIEDSGVGISEDQQDRIFEPFATVGSSDRVQTGLGLAISRRIAQLMDGRVTLESTTEEGSLFSFELPVRVAKQTQQDDAGFNSRSNTELRLLDPRRILIVDDNQNIRTLMATLLRKSGYEVDQAGDGQQALLMLEAQTYTAILTDLNMPKVTGIELARIVRSQRQEDDWSPALILLTGSVADTDVTLVRSLFDAVLLKPITTVELENTLSKLVNHRSLSSQH